MKRTLIALTTAVAVVTGSITAMPAQATTETKQTTAVTETESAKTTEPATKTTEPAPKTTEPKSSIGDGSGLGEGSSKKGGWSPTGSTPLDLVLILAGALGISFLVQPFIQGGFDKIVNDLKHQFKLPM